MRDVHGYALFVHGALTALHCLGAVYGVKRRNWLDLSVHIGAGLFSLRAARHHARQAHE